MRRKDKIRNIERANLLAEQRYLDSKEVLQETVYGHNGMEPFMNVNKDGTFSSEEEEEAISETMAENGPPNIGHEPDRPPRARVAPKTNPGPADIVNEPDRPPRARVAPQGPPNIVNEPDRPPRARVAPKTNPTEGENLTEGGIDPSVVMNMIDAAGDWITGGGMVSIGGESVPKNLATLIMGLMPASAAAGFVVNFWGELKSKLGMNDVNELSSTQKGKPMGGTGKSDIDPTYTHFAVDKGTGEIVNGWQYDSDTDVESIREYCKIDISDMFPDRKVSEFKVLTTNALKKQGIDPFDSANWYKTDTGITELSPAQKDAAKSRPATPNTGERKPVRQDDQSTSRLNNASRTR